MKLSEYLNKLATDKEMVCDDRIVYLYDTKYNTYYTKVLTLDGVDADGANYMIVGDEPFNDYDQVKVIKAWTLNDTVNCMMGLETLTCRYCESEA